MRFRLRSVDTFSSSIAVSYSGSQSLPCGRRNRAFTGDGGFPSLGQNAKTPPLRTAQALECILMTMRHLLAAFTLLLVAALAADAVAQTTKVRRFAVFGKVPQQIVPEEVGPAPRKRLGVQVEFFVDGRTIGQSLSANLSEACQGGRFNQQLNGGHFVVVPMPDGGKRRMGFAGSNGLNLHDPGKLRGRDQAYLFELDGTSECRVYAFATIF